jgi:hypothetical protein
VGAPSGDKALSAEPQHQPWFYLDGWERHHVNAFTTPSPLRSINTNTAHCDQLFLCLALAELLDLRWSSHLPTSNNLTHYQQSICVWTLTLAISEAVALFH